MLFNSLAFLVFLPVVLVTVGVLPRRWRNPFLLLASYYFYACWDWRFLSLLCITTVVDYCVALWIHASDDERRRKLLLLASITINLGILGFFKYFNFFLGSALRLLQTVGIQASPYTLSVILPVGISFYTFQSMSYAIDVYRRQMEPVRGLLDFALYVSYFPQLVAGPIERASHLMPQILAPAPVTAERVEIGLVLILVGFVRKVLIADGVAPEVDRLFSGAVELNSGLALRAAVLFSLQVYGDFAGYSDIARGTSELLGIRLRNNFEQPYLSRSMTEVWTRWHVSLSSWLRDYLYIPLGGNRYGTWKTYRNLMLTMLIGGLWHGANWTFVAWGGLHGLFLVIERMLGVGRNQQRRTSGKRTNPLVVVCTTLYAFSLWTLAVVFFRSRTVSFAVHLISSVARLENLTAIGLKPFLVGAAVLAIDIPQYLSGEHAVFRRLPWWVQSPLYATACLLLILLGGLEVPFIYFQF